MKSSEYMDRVAVTLE